MTRLNKLFATLATAGGLTVVWHVACHRTATSVPAPPPAHASEVTGSGTAQVALPVCVPEPQKATDESTLPVQCFQQQLATTGTRLRGATAVEAVVPAGSRAVTADLARAVAAGFLTAEVARQAASVKDSGSTQEPSIQSHRVSGTVRVTAHDGSTLAYVHALAPHGFIVTSADIGIRPVIAFSYRDEFPLTDSPQNVLLHLLTADMIARKQLLDAATDGSTLQPQGAVHPEWKPYLK